MQECKVILNKKLPACRISLGLCKDNHFAIFDLSQRAPRFWRDGAMGREQMHIRRDWIGAVRAYATGHFVVVYGQRERVRVYYCSTYYKAVRVGRGDSGGHVLRETTSPGLCGLVCPSRTSNAGEKEIV